MKLRRIINRDYVYIPFFAFCLVFSLLYYSSKSPILWGAILASLTGFSSYWVQRLAETSRKLYDTLVHVEQELNTALSDLSINDSMMGTATRERGIPLILPRELRIEEQHIQEISRAELKKVLFSLFIGFRRYNGMLQRIITAFEREVTRINTNLAIYGHFKAQTMLEEEKRKLKGRLKSIQRYGEELTDKTKDALAHTRVFLKNDKSRVLEYVTKKYFDKQEHENSVKIQRRQLAKEIS